jgi:hypothetical protein
MNAKGIQDHPILKLGKDEAKRDGRNLRMASIMTAAPPPEAWDFDALHPTPPIPLPMFDNDRLGCHSADTEVLTEHGWKFWLDYDGRSLLGTMNQQTGLLEFQAPIACQRFAHDGPMAFTGHRGLDFALTPDHRMFYAPYKIPNPYFKGGAYYEPYRFGEIAVLPTRCRIPGATTGFIGTRLEELSIGRRFWAGTDFLKLLALVISDGYVGGGTTQRSRISFCCFRDDRREMVKNFADSMGIKEQARRGVWVFNDAELAEWLRANIYVGNEYRAPYKRVPELVKVAHQDQIGDFLKFFGDQGIQRGSRAFYSSSKRLIDDLQELLLRIGKRATLENRGVRESHTASDGRIFTQKQSAYELHEYQDSDITLQRASRLNDTVAFDHYKGEVFCATVPNSTLVTRRNGRLLISGNCCVISARAHSELRFEELEQKKIISITDRVVENEYFRESGGEDDGLVMLDSIKLWRTRGWRLKSKTYRIKVFAEVDRANHIEVMQSIIAKNGIQIGLSLPLSAQAQFENGQTWDFVSGSHGQANSWGGHCVTVPAYNAIGPICVTWATRHQMTWAFWDAYCDEAYWLLDALDKWLKPVPEAPVSIDTTQVEDYLTEVSPVEPDPTTGVP